MDNKEDLQINININIIIGDVTRSVVIQGGDCNAASVSSGNTDRTY